MSGTGQLPELESLRTQLADVARELAERDRTLHEQTTNRDRQLQDLQEQSVWLRTIVEGTATDTGEQFFASLVNQLTSTLQVQYAVIGTVTEAIPRTVHTIAVSSEGALVSNFEYALSQTPCDTALTESFATFDSRVQETFPNFELLAGLSVDSYCGVPIRIKGGTVLGILAIMDTKPLRNSEWLQSLLTLLAARAGAELQRQRAETAQREAESRLRFTQVAVDQSFDGVLWADDSTRFIYANDAACRSLGYSREELLGLTIADIAPGHDPERFQQRLDKIKQGGAAIYESVHRRKDGTEFPVEVSVTYLDYGGNGYTCGIIRDITERRRAEQERLQALADLRNITETVPDLMFTLDLQGNLAKWNHRVVEITGYTSEDLQGKSALAFVPANEQEQTTLAIQRAFTEGTAELEGHLLTKDQRLIPYHWTGAALKDPQGRIIGITGIGRDVSAQRHTAKALHHQRRHLLEAQALAHLGSWEWDIESGDTLWSEEQFRIFGYEPGTIAVTYDTFLAALLPDDHDRVLTAVNDALLGKRALDLECRVVRPNGDIRVIHMRADVQRDATAHPIAMAGTALDITERKHTEEALRASEERWHLAVQGSNDGIWDWNIQAGEIFFSARWKAMRGFADHEVRNHIDEWRSRIHHDDLDHVLLSIDHYLAKQTSAFCEEYRVQRKDGSYMWILDRGVALWAEDGTPVRMAGSETDITSRKESERQRVEQEERLRLAMEIAELATWDWNIHTNRVLWSANCEQVKRLQPGTFSGTLAAYQQLVHPDDRQQLQLDIERALTEQSTYWSEHRIVPPGGDLQWVESNGQVYRDEMGRPIRMLGTVRNITARKRMEESLRASEERILLAAEGSTDALWDAYPNHGEPWYAPQTSIWWSPRIRELLGLEEEERFETLGQWAARLHPDDKDRVFSQLAAHIEHRVPYDAEYRLRTKRGDYLWIRGRGQAMWDEQGTPRRMSGSCQNITERKRAEEALRESEERYRTLVELSPSGVFVFSEGRTVYVNSMAMTLLGATEPNDILARSPFEFIHPDYHEDVTQNLRRVLAGEATVHRAERVYLKMDGTPLHVQVEAVRITWNGKPAIQGFFSDITERKRAEDATTRSYDLMKSFVEHTPAAVAMLDNDLRYVAVSRRWLQDYRLGDQKLVGKRHYDIFPEISAMDEWRAIHQRCLTGAVEQREEDRFVRADGSEDWLRWEVRPWQDVTGHTGGIIMFTEVITERKRAEEALRASEERLRLSLEAANQGIYDLNVQTGEAHVSPGYATMLGYDPGSFRETNADWIARSHPHDRTRVQTYYRDYIEGKTAEYRTEFRQRAQNGEWRWILSLGRIVERSAKGEPLRMLGTHTDITERKQAEEALHDTNYMLQTLIETSPLAIIGLDQDGTNVTRWNPAAERIFGWRAAEVLGHPLPYIPAEDQTRSFAIWEETTQTGVLTGKELQRLRKDGSSIDVAFWSTALKDAQGTVTGTFAFIADITDRKRTEEALTRSEQQLRTVLDTLPIGVWFTDEKGHVLYGNPVGHRIWTEAARVGLPQPGGEGLWWETIDNIESLHRWAVSTVLARGHGVQNETLAIETRTGERRTIRNSAVPVKNDTGEMLGAIVLNEDITDRVRAENALHQEHALLMAVMDAATDIIFVKDLEGRYIHINRAGARALRMPVEEVIGWNDYAIWPSDLAASCRLADRRVLETGEPVTVEETSVCDGITTIYLTTKAPYRNSEGQIIGVIGVARDITERKQAEEALREQHALLSAIMNTTMDIIFVKDIEGHYLHMNPAGARAVGLSPQEVVGKDDDAIWPADLAACCKEADRLILSTGSAQTLEESTLADGKRITYLTTKAPYRDAGGNMIGIIGVAHDISVIKQSEENLRKSHAFIRQIIDTDPNFVFAKDGDGRFTLVNKALAEAYGSTVDQVIGKTDADFNPHAEEVAHFLRKDRQVLDHVREEFIPEERITDATGSVRWLQTVKRPILDETGHATMVLGVATDITERKRIEETLRQRERDLRTALDERERISQDLHDGILQSLYAVGLGLEACKPLMTQRHYKKAAASMDRAIGHLNHVMSEVRNFIAGLESQILQGSTFPMALRTMVQTLTANHPIPCTLTIDECLADTFSTEQALHLLNVVREALSNSLRHAEATRTTVSLKSLSRSIRLTIADNGRGFNPASMHGAGHGLTNMEARARKVGGRFAIRSVPQHGTRITIDLPKETRHAESKSEHGSTAARR